MRSTPIRRRSVQPKPKLIRECDALWSQVVHLRANNLCEWCGKPSVDAHHMDAKKGSSFLRHEIENGVALCKGCHLKFHTRTSRPGWKLFEQQRPDDCAYVDANRNIVHKLTVDYYRLKKSELSYELERLSR